jgi:AcrR family transcriptional regulator
MAHSTSVTPRPPGRPRSALADSAILRAALALFAERGLDNISIDEIAERAGVARTTVYRRWPSKMALIAEAIASERGAPELEAGVRTGSVGQMLEAIAQALTAPEMKRIMARLVGAAGDHPELMAIYWRGYMEPRRQAVLNLLSAAQAEGQIPSSANLAVLLDVISGVVTYEVLIRPGERSAEEVKTHLLSVLRELGCLEPRSMRATSFDPASTTNQAENENE